MELFLKAAAAIIFAVIFGLTLSKHGKDISLLLSILACCMVAAAALSYLEPVIRFFQELQSTAKLEPEMLSILLKAVGIGLLAEITNLVCTDAGNATLGKTLQILAAAVILWLSLPLFRGLMNLVQNILGEI